MYFLSLFGIEIPCVSSYVPVLPDVTKLNTVVRAVRSVPQSVVNLLKRGMCAGCEVCCAFGLSKAGGGERGRPSLLLAASASRNQSDRGGISLPAGEVSQHSSKYTSSFFFSVAILKGLTMKETRRWVSSSLSVAVSFR